MAVNPVQFLVASNASITDGSKIVNISGNVDCSRVYSGTAVFLGGADNPAEAVSGTSPDGSGNSTITLRNNWSQGDIVNQQLVSFNTNEGLAEAISNVREIVSNVSAIEDLATQGLIKRIDDNNYEVVNISVLGESLVGANDASTARSVLGLGSAATKNVGTAVGNVMEVGAFGVGDQGAVVAGDNANNLIEGGIYRVTNTMANTAIAGTSCIIVSRSFNVVGQIQTDGNNTWTRRSTDTGTTWQPWFELYHSGNSVNPLEFGVGTDSSDTLYDEPYGTDLNNYMTSGSFFLRSNFITASLPPEVVGSTDVLNLVVSKRAGGEGTYQELTGVRQGSGNVTDRVFHRSEFLGVWTPWVEEYNSGNILGTVSQSGGIPTGAIIQRGSNVNGEFVRFADGTQICTQRLVVNVTVAAGAEYTPPNWTPPSNFISESAVTFYNTELVFFPNADGTGVPIYTLGYRFGATHTTGHKRFLNTGSSSAANIGDAVGTNNADSVLIHRIAVGRWF